MYLLNFNKELSPFNDAIVTCRMGIKNNNRLYHLPSIFHHLALIYDEIYPTWRKQICQTNLQELHLNSMKRFLETHLT